jgi:hypothetical protein
MNVSRTARRLATAGVATALATGALVGGAASTATAATVSNAYTCALPNVYSGDFTATVSGELPVPQYWAGAGVPAGFIPVTVKATVPDDAAGLLGAAGVTQARSDDFGFGLGTSKVGAPIKGSFAQEAGHTVWNATGANVAFQTPAPGHYDAVLPTSFSITTMQGETDSVTLTCNLKDESPQNVGSIDLMQQKSSTVVEPKVIKVKRGHAAKVPVAASSTSMGGAVSGKVAATEGKKTLDSTKLKKGLAVLDLGKKLKVGKHKIAVSYLGTPSVAGSSDKVVVKVVK